jgi:hypothetical protein
MAEKPFDAGEILRQLEEELFDDFGETALAIARNLITRSPVGDPDRWQDPDAAPPGYVGGHFRRNWIVSVGGFNEAILEGVDPNGAPTIAAAVAQIEAFKRGTFGLNLVIQNNVPYANRLAQGHPTLAEAGWVDEEIEVALEVPGGQKDLD